MSALNGLLERSVDEREYRKETSPFWSSAWVLLQGWVVLAACIYASIWICADALGNEFLYAIADNFVLIGIAASLLLLSAASTSVLTKGVSVASQNDAAVMIFQSILCVIFLLPVALLFVAGAIVFVIVAFLFGVLRGALRGGSAPGGRGGGPPNKRN